MLLLVFNRPDTTDAVINTLAKVQPRLLYVASDGPRAEKPGEMELVEQARQVATKVDWPCTIQTLFREQNLGCQQAVSSAVSWFLEHEESGIILEDDCLAHPDFFHYCAELLDRYRENENVIAISGNNFQNGIRRGSGSYYFSKFNHCWGWATWRSSWAGYDPKMKYWPQWRDSEDWERTVKNARERQHWEKIFDDVHAGLIDSWAYPWTAHAWRAGGLTALPNVNLVSNIGFGTDATHTTDPGSPYAKMQTRSLEFPLKHPVSIEQDAVADTYYFKRVSGSGLTKRGIRFLKKCAGRILRIAARK